MNLESIIDFLEKSGSATDVQGMQKYGIKDTKIYGVRIPVLRKLASEIGKDHELAIKLWEINSRETRILATMIAEKERVTEKLMEKWVSQFDNWETCDQCIQNLFEKTPFAYSKAMKWCRSEKEFVKRAGFVLMARLAVSDKKAPDSEFLMFVPFIENECNDSRHMVKKGASWALRQIGKRNINLHNKAMQTAYKLRELESTDTKWIAQDVLKELNNQKIIKRIKGKKIS